MGCITLAAWSKAVGINDSPNGLLSTYSIMLLVVFFLQSRGILQILDVVDIANNGTIDHSPPMLPSEDMFPSFLDDELGRLLLGFFLFLVSFHWDAWVVSARCGAPLLRTQKPKVR